MAKKENREGVALQCTECKEINYLTSKNKKNTDFDPTYYRGGTICLT